LFESLRFALACRQELLGAEIYLERFSWMSYGGLLAGKWFGVPLVLEYNGDPLADLDVKNAAPTGKQLKISSAITRWVLQQAPHIVASGEGWRKNCIERWHVAPAKVTTIENGTELLRLLKRDELRSFGPVPAPEDATNLVYIGSFNAWHGVPILLRAFHKAIQQCDHLRLMLIGAGDGFQEARELSSQLGLDGLVTFTGRLLIEDYAEYLAQSDIGLSPYCGWEEYSGLKLFDYKAAGLACIASGKNGQPLTLKHGKTGLIVPPCDEQALCEAICQLACDRDYVQRMGQAARLEAEAVHGWDNTVRQLEQVFTSLSGL
jgi:glycosyltransferase involved in cell wall biosynthesis